MSRSHFWYCITTWVQLISNYKEKQGEEDWEGRSWAENQWKCCWLPSVRTHCQKQGHAILSFCIVKNLKGEMALSCQEHKWLLETILSPTRDDDLLPKITKSFSNYENPQDLEHHCWFSPSPYGNQQPSFTKHQGRETGTAAGWSQTLRSKPFTFIVRLFIMHLYISGKTRADKKPPIPLDFQIHPEVGIQKRETPILPPVMETSR